MLSKARKNDKTVEPIVQRHGDLLFDLCESTLGSGPASQAAFRHILKDLGRAAGAGDLYKAHEREWVLKVACDRLVSMASKHSRRTTASEQIELDSNPDVSVRLKNFDFYFHRLKPEDKLVILLKDKYQLPNEEIASAMTTPFESLKIRRQQALRTLEDWIWSTE